MKTIIRLENASKDFGENKVLKDINLEIKKGEIISIIGPSGSGKTTLLRCISMLDFFSKGNLIIDEKNTVTKDSEKRDIIELRKRIGVVFQDFNLWPHKTVLENIIYAPINVKGEKKNIATKKAEEMLKKVGLSEKANEYPDALSGGQKQRVAIARTLAMEPEIVLFDEITSALDPEMVGEILKIIKRLAKDGMTMLVITHQMRFASEISDKVIFLDNGRIVEKGNSQEIFRNPKEKRTKEFLNSIVEKKQEINVYETYEDFQAYHIGLLKRVKENCVGYVMGAVGDRWFECMGDSYKEYEKIMKKKKITWKWVSYKINKLEKDVLKNLGNQLQISLIPKKFATPSNYNIWEDTIILQTFGDPPVIIEIRNKHLVKGYLNYFKLLWDMGKKIK